MSGLPDTRDETGRTSSHDLWMGRALLAFPQRWRDERGAELMEVSQALSNSANVQRPPVRELADVVRGGLTVRIQDRPPLRYRLLYRWAHKPVPQQYWGWMRDDLRSRFLGVRLALQSTAAYAVVIWASTALATPGRDRGLVMVMPVVFFTIALIFAGRNAKGVRARIKRKLGFDLITWGELTPESGVTPAFPTWPALPPPPPRRVPAPNARLPIRHLACPLACWGLVCGAALIAGAARPNTVASIGPFRFASDPNSPLASSQVTQWSGWLVVVSALLVGAILTCGWLRSGSLASHTVHPVTEFTQDTRRTLGTTLSVTAVPFLAVGLSGIMPDLACMIAGCALVLGSAALVGLALTAWRLELRLGRSISFADLIVGELWQRRWDGLTPGTFIGVTNVTSASRG